MQAFGVSKSRTTAYHPQGNGMVERFDRSLLQLLCSYVETQSDWERYLLLVLYAYRTSVHSSTGSSPFLLMFGRNHSFNTLSPQTAFNSSSYPAYLQNKLAEFHDFVESNLAEAADRQKSAYDHHSLSTKSSVGDLVWLSIPTA